MNPKNIAAAEAALAQDVLGFTAQAGQTPWPEAAKALTQLGARANALGTSQGWALMAQAWAGLAQAQKGPAGQLPEPGPYIARPAQAPDEDLRQGRVGQALANAAIFRLRAGDRAAAKRLAGLAQEAVHGLEIPGAEYTACGDRGHWACTHEASRIERALKRVAKAAQAVAAHA